MYIYSEIDQTIVDERVAQFREQMQRFLSGQLSPSEFLPLRLQNGLYVQRHAPMLRISVPYGMLSSQQVRMLAHIARHYDKDYGHISTRQNIQFNWIKMEEIPDVLADLASVQMHGIQTSGNCIRNVTSDPYAGVIADEIEDPRLYCEIIRQWATFHPEFAYLPRKFKIAVNASTGSDRVAVQVHDIGVDLVKNAAGEIGFRVLAGGGLGRTPVIGAVMREFVPKIDLLSYLEAILRVYNRYGRRDNKYKARIKILVKALGAEVFAEKVEAEWQKIKEGPLQLTTEKIEAINHRFTYPKYLTLNDHTAELEQLSKQSPGFAHWLQHNTYAHKQAGYIIVNLSLKKIGVAPGDIDSAQLLAVADLADEYSLGEIRTTHQQNIVLADVEQTRVYELWQKLKELGLATATINTLADIICCPGGDFCALANAKSIPIAEAIQRQFDDLDYLYDLGDIELNISGCMNACGHHHVGNIGILGVDKKGQEFYQISVGGASGKNAAIGEILGPSFEQNQVPNIVQKIIDVYVEKRIAGESFLETYQRIGIESFKERVYEKNH